MDQYKSTTSDLTPTYFLKTTDQFIKPFLMVLTIFVLNAVALGQTVGDYRTNADGNWSNLNTWRRWSGSNWNTPTAGQGYPGQYGTPAIVTILNTDDVTLDVTPANSLGTLDLQSGNNTATITISGTNSLSVNGAITIGAGTGSGDHKIIAVGAGTLSCGSISVSATGNSNRNSGITLSSGTVTVNGNITMSDANDVVTFTGAGLLNITGTMSGGTLTPSTGTVNYSNAGTQTVGTYTYNNLTLSGSGLKTMNGTVSNILSMEGTATASATPTYGGSATLQYKGSALQTTGNEFPTTFNGTGGVIINNSFGVNMSGNHTITNALTLTSGAFSIGANTLTLNGTVPICGSLVGGTTSNLTIGGTAINTNLPSVTLNNLILNRVAGVTLCGNVTVLGTLTLTNGNLSLSDYSLTIADGASISGTFSDTKMISCSGTGSLIKESTTAAGLNMVYPLGTGSYYSPMTLASVAGTVAGTASVTVRAVGSLAPNTNSYDLNKYWNVTSNNLSAFTANASFEYQAGEVLGNASAYRPRYSSDNGTTWVEPTGASAEGVNPFSSTGTSVLTGLWTAVEIRTTYYSLASGNWTNWETWTLDPSGSLPNNPDHEYPNGASVNAVIKDGKTVTMDVSGIACRTLTIDGRLNLVSTNSHNITNLRGSGRLLLSSDYWFASCDDSHFISPDQGDGTVVYYGTDLTLATSRTFGNMEVAMTVNQVLTLMNDFTLNGNLTITTGIFQINDISSTVKKTLNIGGNVQVNLGASFTVGTGDVDGTAYDSYHDVICYGDFTNNGTVQFSNQAQPTYDALATNGGVNLLMKGASNNTFACNNTTNLYRLVVDKGTDQTYILSLDVDQTKFFRLYAANNTSDANGIGKALYIANGTLKLQGEVFIPSLTEGNSDYYIPTTGCLWMDSPGATVYTTANSNAETTIDGITSTGVLTTATDAQSFSIYGKFRITDGTLNTKSHGFVVWAGYDAIIQIEGGTVYTPGLRSATASTGKYSYIQTGGNVYMSGDIGSDGLEDQSATFSIKGTDNVFIMSAGLLEIQDANTVTAVSRDRVFEVYADAGNYNITGGTIRILNYDADAGNDFYVYSTAPFYNLEIATQTTNVPNVYLESAITIQNNLTLGNYSLLDVTSNNYGVTIGKDVTIGATSSTFNARSNTTTFNGAQNSVINNSSATAITLYDLVLSKSTHPTSGSYYNVSLGSTGSFNVTRNVTLTKGILSLTTYEVNVGGNVEITDGHITNNTGKLILNSSTATQTLKGATGAEQEFGNIKLSNGNYGVQLLSDVNISNIELNTSGTGKINMGSYNLTVTGSISNIDATNRWIYGSGLASDGGLSFYISGIGTFNYPIGTSTKYTPNSMTVSAIADDGYITCIPVNATLATTNPSGGIIMPYYWKMTYSSFTDLPTVAYTFTYAETDNTGYYPGKVLDISPYTRSYINDIDKVVESNNTILFDTPFTLEKANYTAGAINRFTGTVATFYSNGWYVNWNDGSHWHQESKTGTIGTVPTAGSIVYIYSDGASQGRIWGNAVPNAPAEIVFQHNYTLYPAPDGENIPRLQFNTAGTFNLGRVSGTGMITYEATTAITLNADFGDFGTNPDSYYLYYGGAATLTSIPSPIPNIMFEGTAKNINQNITVNSDFIVQGGTTITPYQNIEIKGDLCLGMWDGGTFQFRGSGTSVTITVGGDIDFTRDPSGVLGTRTIQCESTTTDIQHTLIVKGDILHGNTNGFTFDLYNAANRNRVVLELAGEGTHSYSRTSTSVPEFFRLVVNKGNAQSNSFTFDQYFTLQGTSNTATKALEIKNGTLLLNNSSFNIALTTGSSNFSIPSTASLELHSGSYTANGTSGIDLDGRLYLNGATLDMSGSDNPIEISASGNANLEVAAGTLTVGGQIRRGASTDIGILDYNQSGGTVVVGRNTASVTNRGVFEVMGTGSSLTITGGDLYIVRASSASVPALYLMPETVNLDAANTIHIGHSSTTGQTIGIYSTAALQNLDILNNNTATLLTVPLSLNGNLNIISGTFNANGLDLNIAGDFANAGTFTSNNNSTSFNGTASQSISGVTTTFYNFSKPNSNTLNLNSPIIVSNELVVDNGQLVDNGNTISVSGNCTFNGTHVYGASGKGVYMTGTSQQQLEGTTGVFGMLTVNNPNGVNIPVGNVFTINDYLRMEQGVLQINKNLLTLSASCQIVEANTFSTTNMIQTNVSFTDNGIKKFINSGAQTFLFPIGSGGRYTPVTLNLNSTSAGSITVKAAAEMHPSVIDDTETPSLVDSLNVLQYHWILAADGISNFDGTITMKYDASDVRLASTDYDITDYITARLLSDGTGHWNKYGDDVNETTHELTFTFTGNADAEISGDYTAGLAAAIPDVVPIYKTVAAGAWNDPNTWATYDPTNGDTGLPGVGVPSSGPRGCILYVDNDLTLSSNYMAAYQTVITSTGILQAATTLGHRLGTVTGDGLLVVASGSLPAGVYTDFFSPNKGSLEYTSILSNDYDILTEVTTVNNLILSGSGERRFPNLNFQLYGDLTIAGADAVNEHSRTISVKGDVTFSSGTFTANSGKLALNGTASQAISGANTFTGTNAMYNLEINNSAGATFSNSVDVGNVLTLTNGIIHMGTGTTFAMTNNSTSTVSGGSTTSYVDGEMSKKALAGQGFAFPIGNSVQFKQIEIIAGSVSTTWSSQYLGNNANTVIETSPVQDIIKVSNVDRWYLGCPVSATGTVKLYWNTLSDVGDGVTAPYSTLRVAMENATSEWESMGNTAWSGTMSSGSVTSSTVSFSDHFFTLGSTSADVPLPITLASFNGYKVENGIELKWVTAAEINNDYFEIQRSSDAINFTTIASIKGAGNSNVEITYSHVDKNPIEGINYYRIKQTDFNGTSEVHGDRMVQVSWTSENSLQNESSIQVYPNPYQSGNLNLALSNMEANSYMVIGIYNMNGQVVGYQSMEVPESLEINLIPSVVNQLNKGVYVIQVITGNKTLTSKLVIK
ncbi:MAG: T9SS type A sorting domain-containing protein [Salinivirgaceae bacterium]|nr:T9SS type A sorting domain-containing protein [Salinivirgaceae bacterium]